MSNFWKEYGKAYTLFSQYCNYNDWQIILRRIANEITGTNSNRALSVLDVGTGHGLNALNLLEILYSETGQKHLLDVVEPSHEATFLLQSLLSTVSTGGFLRNIYHNISEIDEAAYDVMIFMHSSYYISEFQHVIKCTYFNNLQKGGKIIILALPDTSPFFLGEKKLLLNNTSTRIKLMLNNLDLKFDSYVLHSRFMLSNAQGISSSGMDAFYHFMTREIIVKDKFVEILRKRTRKEPLDFGDELIVINK